MIEYKEEKKRMFFMGTELASFYVKHPNIEGKEKINSFFDMLASNSMSWFLEQLFPFAREEYEKGNQAVRRSSQKPYRYTLQILVDESGASYRIKLSATLCCGRSEEMERYDEEFIIDAASELIKRKTKDKRNVAVSD